MTDQEKKELAVSEKQAIDEREGEPTREGPMYVPHVDIAEDNEAITLRADLPGVKKDGVDIDVREGILTLTATVEPPPESWEMVYTEYPIGGFARRFSLSVWVSSPVSTAKSWGGIRKYLIVSKEARLALTRSTSR